MRLIPIPKEHNIYQNRIEIGTEVYLVEYTDHEHDMAFLSMSQCSHCGHQTVILRKAHDDKTHSDGQELYGCPQCGWWGFHYYNFWGIHNELHYGCRGTVRNCEVEKAFQPLAVLTEYAEHHPDKLASITPTNLEILVGSVVSDFFDCEVKWTGKGADGGFDLLSVISDELNLVQVKQRQPSKKESVVAVRELLGVMTVERAPKGLFVTTAQDFTRPAEELVAELKRKQIGKEITLVDYDALIDMIIATSPRRNPPWEEVWQPLTHYQDRAVQLLYQKKGKMRARGRQPRRSQR